MAFADPEVTVVHLLRHGEVHNPAQVLYGRLPGYRLSELGRQMAEKVAAVLAERDVTVVAASPLERAQETAAPVAAALGVDVVTDERLIEAENSFQGLTFGVGDGSLRRPGHWRRSDPSPTPQVSPWQLFSASISRSSVTTSTSSAAATGAAVSCARSSGEATTTVTSRSASTAATFSAIWRPSSESR